KSTEKERKCKLPQKQAKITSLKNLRTSAVVADKRKDNTILQALQAILQDKGAQFRSPQQEEAIRLATAKQSPLITILPTGSKKSLIFIVPAMLVGAGVTIVVALYTELKRQLYSILRVRNRQGVIEVKKLGRKELYTTLAIQSARHLPYNSATTIITPSAIILIPISSPSVNRETPYIIATAALGIGIDIIGIIHVIHLKAPFSIINYAQEAGQGRQAREPITAEIVIKERG
ncbi:hypothetical protein LB507_011573, partial [Fusarium sp. FIESC RH6]